MTDQIDQPRRPRPKDRYFNFIKKPQEKLEKQKKLIDLQENVIKTLSEDSTRDPLTGVYNRRYLDSEISKLQPHDKFAIVMIDVDHFRNFNETYGHLGGDKALKYVSRILQDKTQIIEGDDPDIVAKYGGEEFTIIFKRFNDPKVLKRRVEEIREEIKGRVIDRDNLRAVVTASFGIAFSDGKTSAGEVLNKADKALYVSKIDGRDKVTMAE